MFVPLITLPSAVSRAAPTRNFEYGEYENSLAGLMFSFGSYGRYRRTRLPSKQDLARRSCCSADNAQVLVAADILSLVA